MIHKNGYLNGTTARVMDQVGRDLDRRFGNGTLMRLGQAAHLVVESIPTGFPTLDEALGIGGLPRGRVVEVYGPEGVGKTTLALHVIAEAQARGGVAAFVDMEHALDPGHAAGCGVYIEDLYISQPGCAEEGLEIAEGLIRAGIDVVVVDSTAALVSRHEIEGDMGDNHYNHGAMMSQAMRKLAGPVRKNNTLLIFTSQIRMNPDVRFGSPEKSTGGKALRFYASVRIDLRRVAAIKAKGRGAPAPVTGQRVRAAIRKNKVAPPFKSADFDIMYE